jgi:hypothetical protein
VFLGALDASKAFDRINHTKLFDKLMKRNVPLCLLSCWYEKLFSCVRKNGVFSTFFIVSYGVIGREGFCHRRFVISMWIN